MTHVPGIHTASLKRSTIGCVAIYCATVLCLFITYASISSNLASSIAMYRGGYYQLPSNNIQVCLQVICWTTLCWNPPPGPGLLWGSSSTSLSPKLITPALPPAPPPWKTSPTPLDLPTPLPVFLTHLTRSSLTFSGPPQLPANYHPKLLWYAPSIWRTLMILVVCHRPGSLSPLSPSSPRLSADAVSAPPPWRTGRWWCDGHPRPSTVPSYHNGGTVDGGGCPLWY